MSSLERADGALACLRCLRRSWLLTRLGAHLDRHCGTPARLLALLALPDGELIDALGGRARAQLAAEHAAFVPSLLAPESGVTTVCRHAELFPRRLRAQASPALLHVGGSLRRLAAVGDAPLVVLTGGGGRASEYGTYVSETLGRELASAGVTVAGPLADACAAAALTGALAAGGTPLAVLSGSPPVSRRQLLATLARRGCVICEIPWLLPARRWARVAALRSLVQLAAALVVVEALETPRELVPATLASALARPLGAVPGRLTSPLAAGPNSLVAAGAALVRTSEDVLSLLSIDGPPGREHVAPADALEPRLRDALSAIGDGADTPAALAAGRADLDVLVMLSELELLGLVTRGADGRYLPRVPLAPGAARLPPQPPGRPE